MHKDVTESYHLRVVAIQQKLERLVKAAHKMEDKKQVSWADVGEVAYIDDRLRAITNLVFKEGEYAN